ncbi:hypothetical protein ACTXT7_015325 [Hymenolepis weldensis]
MRHGGIKDVTPTSWTNNRSIVIENANKEGVAAAHVAISFAVAAKVAIYRILSCFLVGFCQEESVLPPRSIFLPVVEKAKRSYVVTEQPLVAEAAANQAFDCLTASNFYKS